MIRHEQLAEDWRGRQWHRQAGGYHAPCPEPGCLWRCSITRQPDGWWWRHEDRHGVLHEAGPFQHWQQASTDAIDSGHARPYE